MKMISSHTPPKANVPVLVHLRKPELSLNYPHEYQWIIAFYNDSYDPPRWKHASSGDDQNYDVDFWAPLELEELQDSEEIESTISQMKDAVFNEKDISDFL